MAIKLYVVDTSPQFISKLEEIFFEGDLGIKVIGSAVNHKSCTDDISTIRQADVFLISAFLPDKTGIDLVSHLRKTINPNAKYFVTVNSATRNLADEALRVGAVNYLQKPFAPQTFVDMVYEAVGQDFDDEDDEEVVETKPTIDIDFDDEYEDDEEGNVLPQEEEEDDFQSKKHREVMDIFGGPAAGRNIFQTAMGDGQKPNKVCVFTSPKSVGKTSILVNVAAAVKKFSEYEPKIIIVDLNLVYPAVQFKFNQEELQFSKKNIYDIMDDISDMDIDTFKQAVWVHKPTQIHILDTPFESIRDFSKVTAEKIRKLILFLRENYDLVLVDTSGNIRDDATAVPLTMSDQNIILFESDVASLVHIRKFVEMVNILEKKLDKQIIDRSFFIINRFNAATNLSVEAVKSNVFDIEGKELQVPLYIPEEPLMTKYSNLGQFIINKPGEISDKISQLSQMIYPFYGDGEVPKTTKKQGDVSIFSSLKKFLKK